MDASLILFGIAWVLLLIAISQAMKASAKRRAPNNVIKLFTPNGQIWVRKMIGMFNDGVTWAKSSELLFEKTFNVTLTANENGVKYGAYLKAIGVPSPSVYLDAPQDSSIYKAGSFFDDLNLALQLRYIYQYSSLSKMGAEDVWKKHRIRLQPGEVSYDHRSNIDWHEEQTIQTNVVYHGTTMNSEADFGYRSGAYSLAATDIKRFVPIDRGDLLITDRRVIFIGKSNGENRTVPLASILNLTVYRDGVILGLPDGRKPLIVVPGYVDGLIGRDDLNLILRVLHRLMSGTQDMDLTPKDWREI